MVQNLDRLDAVCRRDLKLGDCARVRTRNSTYSILVLGNDLYSVSGGWFDLKGFSPMTTTIVGCTWGGLQLGGGLEGSLRRAVEETVGERAADPLVEEDEHQRGSMAFIGQAVAVLATDALDQSVALHFAQVVAQLSQGVLLALKVKVCRRA